MRARSCRIITRLTVMMSACFPNAGPQPVLSALTRAFWLAAMLAFSPSAAQDQQVQTAAQQEQLNRTVAAQLQLQQTQIQFQQMHAQREQDQQRLQSEIRLQLQQLQKRAEEDRLQLEIDRRRR